MTTADRSAAPRRRRRRDPLQGVLRQLVRPVHYQPQTAAVLPVPLPVEALHDRAAEVLRASGIRAEE